MCHDWQDFWFRKEVVPHNVFILVVRFLLKNAKVLEKIVISEPQVMKYQTGDMLYEILQVTQKSLSFPRSSLHAWLCSQTSRIRKMICSHSILFDYPILINIQQPYMVEIQRILAMNLLQLLLSCSYDFLVMILNQTLDIFMVNVNCFVVYQTFGLILIIMQFQTFLEIVRHFQYPPFLFIESHIFPICLTCAVVYHQNVDLPN